LIKINSGTQLKLSAFLLQSSVGDKLHGVSSPTKWTGYALAASY